MSGRIVTVTLNPALDLQSSADVVRPVHKIRTSDDRVDPGGGGINVARVVHELGGDALALITVGGITGHYIEDLLDEAGVNRIPVPIAGRNRISLTVLERASGLAYRFVPQGPHLAENEWHDVLDRLEAVEACWIVASGSLPPGAPPDAYGSDGPIGGASPDLLCPRYLGTSAAQGAGRWGRSRETKPQRTGESGWASAE